MNKRAIILIYIVLSIILLSGNLHALTPEEKAWKHDILSLLRLVRTPGDYADVVNLIEAAPGLKEDEDIRKAYLDALPEGATLPGWAAEAKAPEEEVVLPEAIPEVPPEEVIEEEIVEAKDLAEVLGKELARKVGLEVAPEVPTPPAPAPPEVVEAKVPEEAREAEMEVIRSHYKSGKDYYKDGKYQEAIAEFEKVLALNPEHRGATRYLKRSQTRLARVEEAIVEVPPEERAPAEGEVRLWRPKPAEEMAIEDLYGLGVHYYENSQYQQAVDQFKEVLAMKPGYKRAGEYISKAQDRLAKEGKEEELAAREAGAELERALALDPEYKKRKEYIGRARAKLARMARANKRREIREHYNLGRYYFDQSRRYLEYLEKGYYDYPHVYSEFGKAIGEFETVLKLDPKHRGARGYLVKSQAKLVRMKVLEKAKREAQARKEESQKAKVERERIEKHYKLGKEYYGRHQYQRAIGEFEDVLAIDYHHTGARRYIVKAKKRLRKLSLAKAERVKEETEIESKKTDMARIKGELLATPQASIPPVEVKVLQKETVLPELGPLTGPSPLPPGATIIKSTNVVNNIEVESSDGKAKVVITLDGPAAYEVGKVINPPILFIDIPDTILGISSESITVASEIIQGIRSIQHKVVPSEELRVMIDLAKWVGYKVTSQANRIYVEFAE